MYGAYIRTGGGKWGNRGMCRETCEWNCHKVLEWLRKCDSVQWKITYPMGDINVKFHSLWSFLFLPVSLFTCTHTRCMYRVKVRVKACSTTVDFRLLVPLWETNIQTDQSNVCYTKTSPSTVSFIGQFGSSPFRIYLHTGGGKWGNRGMCRESSEWNCHKVLEWLRKCNSVQ